MFDSNPDTLNKVEKQLKLNCPSPEDELIRLSRLAASLPEDEIGARVRILVLDIDDLIAQTRWNLGQALLLMEQYPQITANVETEDPIERLISDNEMPAKALHLLRGYIAGADRVLYSDLSQPRRSGTAAGWIYHMMIDDAIYRTIAALDRLAQILWYAAKLPIRNKKGERVKVYFRSKKMTEIDSAIQDKNSRKLVDLASHPFLEYVIGYRDGFAHDMKVYSKIAGSRPIDEWISADGTHFVVKHDKWDAESLFGLANATYHQLTDALMPAIEICESHLMPRKTSQ